MELCTIRAPHDGFVIYANDQRRDIRIEEGMYVRQKQDLMYLPDLNEMEVVDLIFTSRSCRRSPRECGPKSWSRGCPTEGSRDM